MRLICVESAVSSHFPIHFSQCFFLLWIVSIIIRCTVQDLVQKAQIIDPIPIPTAYRFGVLDALVTLEVLASHSPQEQTAWDCIFLLLHLTIFSAGPKAHYC